MSISKIPAFARCAWASEDIDKVRKLASLGVSDVEIGHLLHRSPNAVSVLRNRRGISTKFSEDRTRQWSQAVLEQAVNACKRQYKNTYASISKLPPLSTNEEDHWTRAAAHTAYLIACKREGHSPRHTELKIPSDGTNVRSFIAEQGRSLIGSVSMMCAE